MNLYLRWKACHPGSLAETSSQEEARLLGGRVISEAGWGARSLGDAVDES